MDGQKRRSLLIEARLGGPFNLPVRHLQMILGRRQPPC